MKFNILFTSGGGMWVPHFVSLFRNSKIINFYITDINTNVIAKNFCKKFFRVPHPKDKGFINSIIKIIKKNSINLVIPASDEEALALSKKKNDIEKKFKVKIATVNYHLLKNFFTKDKTYETLKKNNIKVANWRKINNIKELKKNIDNYRNNKKDFVIKPSNSRGGRDILIFRSDIKNIFHENFGREKHIPFKNLKRFNFKQFNIKYPAIIMDRLFGPLLDMDLLCWKGKLLQLAVRERIGSQGINGNIIKKYNKKYFFYAQKVSKIFKLSWIFDCDLMHDRHGNPVIIELNPRLSGSIYSSIQCGIPFIENLIFCCKNKQNQIKKIKIKKDIKILAYKSAKKISNF